MYETTYRTASKLGRSDQVIPDPYLDLASLTMPTTLFEMLNVCEAEWLRNGTYRQAASRIVRYFITSIKFDGQSEEKAQDLKRFLNRSLKVIPKMMLLGDDFLGTGNSNSSLVIPFRRFLRCSKCGFEQPIEFVSGFEFRDYRFYCRCSKCRRKTLQRRVDRRTMEQDRFTVKRWNPKNLRIREHHISGVTEYYYKIPPKVVSAVKSGDRFTLESIPWEFVETIQRDRLFLFDSDVMYHMKEETLATLETGGWGIPRLMSNYAQAWYVRMLKRLNESLALDQVMPFRVVSPAVRWGAGGTDPSQIGVDAGLFKTHMQNMLLDHRMDPAATHVSPIPVEYQTLGGDAKALAPSELIDKGQDELLNGIGIPAQMYRFDLQMQVLPSALRLFQQSWPQLTFAFNGWLDTITGQACTALNWDKPDEVTLEPVTLADDLELRQVWLQMASAGLISRGTAFGPWNLDALAEKEKILREQLAEADLQEEFQEDMQTRQQNKEYARQMQTGGMPGMGGQPGAVGAPAPGGMPPSAMTPGDRLAQADEIAQQLVQAPPNVTRSELASIKAQDETLWALVKGRMQLVRQDASSQGRASLRGGMQGQAPGSPM